MTNLYDSAGTEIECIVEQSLSHFDGIKIKNRLLDGTYHIQTIGGITTIIDVICYVHEYSKSIIDTAEATGAPIKVVKDGRYYKGVMMDTPSWEVITGGVKDERWYQGQFKVAVNEEGSI